MGDHFLSMVAFSSLVAIFFATLNHRERRPFILSMAKTMAWMVLGSLLLATLMYWYSG